MVGSEAAAVGSAATHPVQAWGFPLARDCMVCGTHFEYCAARDSER